MRRPIDSSGDEAWPGGTVFNVAAAAMTIAVLCSGCWRDDRPRGKSWSVATHPRAADRYARLARATLADPEPRAALQRLSCEHARLGDALGGLEAGRRTDAVWDTILRTDTDIVAYDRVTAGTGGGVYEVAGPTCDSLNAAADREDGPIAPAPDSMHWK